MKSVSWSRYSRVRFECSKSTAQPPSGILPVRLARARPTQPPQGGFRKLSAPSIARQFVVKLRTGGNLSGSLFCRTIGRCKVGELWAPVLERLSKTPARLQAERDDAIDRAA